MTSLREDMSVAPIATHITPGVGLLDSGCLGSFGIDSFSPMVKED